MPEASLPSPELTDPTESQDFAALLREHDRTRAEASAAANATASTAGSKQIEATVVAISTDTVFLDIGYKTEGILPLTAFAPDEKSVEPGDRIRVTVRGRDLDGYYELTRQRTAAVRDYTSLEEAFEAKGIVSGTVTGAVKGGLTVDIGMRAFLPASRSGTRDAADLEKLVGQEIRVRITQLDLEGDSEKGGGRPDAIVDRRSVLEEEEKATADQRFSQLTEGATVQGTVRSLTDYGAFVDLGGTDALLHISDIGWHRIASPSEVLTVGDPITAQIVKIDTSDPARRRVSIGLKQLQPHPWDTVPDQFHLGDKVKGVVTRDTEFGAFVELAPGVEGLIHISEMAWGKKVRKPSDIVKPGDVVEAVILSIDPAARRLGLGLKQALGDPWVELLKTLHPGSVVEGPVSRIMKFGAFLEVAPGVEGLIHISEITADRRLNHPSDVLRVGEVVQAQVLEIDREKRQLRLSIKQLIPTGLDEFLAEHQPGDQVTGRILDLDLTTRTCRVELGEGILATCTLPAAAEPPAAAPIDFSQLGSLLNAKWKTTFGPTKPSTSTPKPTQDPIAPGQVRTFRIHSLDPESKRLDLELT